MAAKTKKVSASKKTLAKRLHEYRWVYFLGLPGMIVMFLFSYKPMGNLLMAFQDYNAFEGLWGSQWVGLKHFQRLFADPKFYNMLKNTLVISGLNLLTFPAPIVLALIMNEVRNMKFKKFVQTAVYLPHFLSWAIVCSLTFFLLSTEQGVVNKLIEMAGGEKVSFLFSTSAIYPIIVIQSLWAPSSIWRRSPASTSPCMRRRRWTGPTGSSV